MFLAGVNYSVYYRKLFDEKILTMTFKARSGVSPSYLTKQLRFVYYTRSCFMIV